MKSQFDRMQELAGLTKDIAPKDSEPIINNGETNMDYTVEDSKRIIGGLLYDDFIKMTGIDPMDLIWIGMYPDSADIADVLEKASGVKSVNIAYIKK